MRPTAAPGAAGRPAAGSGPSGRPAAAAGSPSRFAYCVIISAPRYTPRQGAAHKADGAHAGGANADAVAAALVNMVHAQLGPRQNALLGLDARDPDQRAYALRLLAERGIGEAWLQSTPLLYSARDSVFTKPGGVSLQLLLDLAAKIQPRGPTASVVDVLLAYPQRHDLEFEPEWANALEAAERPETRMLASPDMRARMKARTFSTTQRDPVAAHDVTGGMGGMGAPAPPPPPGPQPGVVPRGAPLATVRLAEGMGTYADLSVADAMARGGARRVAIGHVPTGHPDEMPRLLQVEAGSESGGVEDSGVMIDIESRMFERMPQILNVDEQRTLTERDMIKRTGGGTDEEATKREIQRVKLQRAEARLGHVNGGGGAGGGGGAAAAGAAFGSSGGSRRAGARRG
jgi:hypothetical protein